MMKQCLFRGVALAAVLAMSADAQAGWYSSGGSSGSWGGSSSSGSWGGSSGSWGSHGGGLFSRFRARFHSSGGSSSSYSSHGSWGSSGGSSSSSSSSSSYSYSSWGSSGGSSSSSSSYSSHGSWGSSGGSSSSSGGGYVVPAAPADGQYYDNTPTPPAGDNPPAPPEVPMARADSGVLAVSVPADAKVYVNGKATTSAGAQRHYVSRGLRNGFKYAYEVRAQVVRDGRTVEETRTIELRAGETSRLAFNFDPAADVTTSLTLKVPENAKVTLAGSETTSTGSVRTFNTKQLEPGQVWSDYKVQVAWEVDGQVVVKEQTISLKAGDTRTLEFGANQPQIADAR